jgi:hypothetical protein
VPSPIPNLILIQKLFLFKNTFAFGFKKRGNIGQSRAWILYHSSAFFRKILSISPIFAHDRLSPCRPLARTLSLNHHVKKAIRPLGVAGFFYEIAIWGTASPRDRSAFCGFFRFSFGVFR